MGVAGATASPVKNELLKAINGQSGIMEELRTQVARYAVENEPILLLGETGVGKNHIARLIHRASGRAGEFVQVHTPSIPGELFESEIFGHRKGSFTSACSDQTGLVEHARGGTLFLDEISEIPLAFQAKLLQFLDTYRYRPLGESREREAQVRVITATNRRLTREIKQNRFRKDLYYRLNVLPVAIPPLRRRKEDIRAIVETEIHLLRGKPIGPGFWEEMFHYHWPGNVRQLIHLLKRAGIELEPPVTGAGIRELIHRDDHEGDEGDGGSHCLECLTDRILDDMEKGGCFWKVVKEPFLKRDLKRQEVKSVIRKALARSDGKYKHLLKCFGLPDNEYKKFMRFLYDNGLK